ncbi:serine-rich adhesin for platelets-like isoform X2 [Macrobrachium rosenbergii]|uniref:serine-rich adhesin for platelets-like isoform X2 n=1 Tax=Macrobrachium rosenbergii TaxID=79674 RepID=UPI0034D46562
MEKTHHLFVTFFLLLLSSFTRSSPTSSQRCQRISVSRHVVRLQSSSPPPFLAQPSSLSSSSSSSFPSTPSHAPLTTGSPSLNSNPSSSNSAVVSDGSGASNSFPPSASNQSTTFASNLMKVLDSPSSSASEPSVLLPSLFPPTVSSTVPSSSAPPGAKTSSPSILPPPPSAPSSIFSSSPPSSVCWTSGRRGRTISLTPDHRGNLWLLTTSLFGSQLTPNSVWVLNFTSMTWNEPGYLSDYVDTEADSSLTASSSSSSIPSTTSPTPGDEKPADVHSPSTVPQPAAFCSWSKGLITIYTSNGSCHIWFLPYNKGRWVQLNAFGGSERPSDVLSVDASWCGRLQDSLWLLASHRRATQKEDDLSSQENNGVKGGGRLTIRQTLWKLNSKGKWSPLDVRYNKDQSLLPSPNARTWSDNQGGLYLLCENIHSENSVHIVKFDQTSGTRTIINLESDRRETFWIPNTTGRLYSLYSDHDGNRVIKTSSYYTGKVISIDSFDTPIRSDILVRINGTIYSNIPFCSVDKDIDVPRTVLELHRFFPATGCSNSTSIINYQYNVHEEVTMLRVSKRIVSDTEVGTNPRVSHTRAVFEEAPSDGGQIIVKETADEEAELVFTASTPSDEEAAGETGLSRSSSVGGNIVVSDIKEASGNNRPSGGPHQRDKNHTNDSIVFFSLSLSIFALVGIVIFVRRCVRCPPAAELGEGGETRGKPPSPLPVLYSIVPDDPAYETNVTVSPCPSYSAIYEVPTPGEETPNAITPNGGTPNFMTPNMNTPGAETPYSVTPSATTPITASPNTIARHDLMSSREFSAEVTYAVTNSATDAINIATNNAFRNHYINTTQF